MKEGRSNKRSRGRPPSDDPAKKTLAGVRVTEAQLEGYRQAARKENKPVAAWVRETLEQALEQ